MQFFATVMVIIINVDFLVKAQCKLDSKEQNRCFFWLFVYND